MKKYIYTLFVLIVTSLMFSSCLDGNLDELPVFSDAEISGVRYADYRWKSATATVPGGEALVIKQTLNIEENTKPGDGQLNVKISVPAASGEFTEAIRNQCSANNISVAVTISTASKITPLEGAPALGKPGDWSKPNKYRVTAADGKTTKDWTITVTEFKK